MYTVEYVNTCWQLFIFPVIMNKNIRQKNEDLLHWFTVTDFSTYYSYVVSFLFLQH